MKPSFHVRIYVGIGSALASTVRLWSGHWRHRQIIATMIRVEVAGRYLGSMLGAAWALLQPLTMLLVYAFAFGVVFKSRWIDSASEGEEINFAVPMFIGLIIYTLFAECVNRAPRLILEHATYVRKVVFPLEILSPVAIGTALFNAGMAFVVWLGLLVMVRQTVPWTIVFLPLVLLPLVLTTAGLVWLLASLGVFVRDLGQFVGLLTMSLLFLSPIFYPLSAVPEAFRPWMGANPLTGIIEEARKVAIRGEWPDWSLLGIYLLVGAAAAHLGLVLFARARRAFADVL